MNNVAQADGPDAQASGPFDVLFFSGCFTYYFQRFQHGRYALLTFATEFPVHTAKQASDFLSVMREWVENSPHTAFSGDDLAGIGDGVEFATGAGNQSIRSIGVTQTNGDEYFAFKHSSTESSITWETSVVFSRTAAGSWIGVRTSNESSNPVAKLPAAKKPFAVKLLLNSLGGGFDGDICVEPKAIFLNNDDIDLAARLIDGSSGCRLPVVYVSAGFDGKYAVSPSDLAHDLAGMAHVVVEPNRAFSRRLQIEVGSQNTYGGAVGIYWPEGTGRRAFFSNGGVSVADLRWTVTDEVRAALLNRRPLAQCTWEVVESAVRRREFELLKASGSSELDNYIGTFDADLKAREQRLEAAEAEIARLQREVVRLQAQESSTFGLSLKTGKEQNLFEGEIVAIVSEALAECANRAQIGSRRIHVLSALVEANPKQDLASIKREKLKSLLRSYRNMDAVTRAGLEELGFSISDEGKHYKLVYQDDDRYTFPLAKSGSDHRGGLNSVSDIAKRIF